jgi:hypothetical protein
MPAALTAPALDATQTLRRHLPLAPPFDLRTWQDWVARLQAIAKEL